MSTHKLVQGDVVLVPFPYSDLTQTKRRPAVVISRNKFNKKSSDVILAAASSNASRKVLAGVKILSTAKDFSQTGLKQSSVICCSKIFTADKAYIDRKLGNLPQDLLEQTCGAVSSLFECK